MEADCSMPMGGGGGGGGGEEYAHDEFADDATYATETCATGGSSGEVEEEGEAVLVVRPEVLYHRTASIHRVKREERAMRKAALAKQQDLHAVSRKLSFADRLLPIDRADTVAEARKVLEVIETARRRQREAGAAAELPTAAPKKSRHRPPPGYEPVEVADTGRAAVAVPELQYLSPSHEEGDAEGQDRSASRRSHSRLCSRPGSTATLKPPPVPLPPPAGDAAICDLLEGFAGTPRSGTKTEPADSDASPTAAAPSTPPAAPAAQISDPDGAALRLNDNAAVCAVAAVAWAWAACQHAAAARRQRSGERELFASLNGAATPRRWSSGRRRSSHTGHTPTDGGIEDIIRKRSLRTSQSGAGGGRPYGRGSTRSATERSPRGSAGGASPRSNGSLTAPPCGIPNPPGSGSEAPRKSGVPVPDRTTPLRNLSAASRPLRSVSSAGRAGLTAERLALCEVVDCDIPGWVACGEPPSPGAAAAFAQAVDDEVAAAAARPIFLRLKDVAAAEAADAEDDREAGGSEAPAVSRPCTASTEPVLPLVYGGTKETRSALFRQTAAENDEYMKHVAAAVFRDAAPLLQSRPGSRCSGGLPSRQGSRYSAGQPPSATADDPLPACSREGSRTLVAADEPGTDTPFMTSSLPRGEEGVLGVVHVHELVLRLLKGGKPQGWTDAHWRSTLRSMNETLEAHQSLILEDNDHAKKPVTGTESGLRNLDVETKLRAHLVYDDDDCTALPKLPLAMQKRNSYKLIHKQRETAKRREEERARREAEELAARLQAEAEAQEAEQAAFEAARQKIVAARRKSSAARRDTSPGSPPHARRRSTAATVTAVREGSLSIRVDGSVKDRSPRGSFAGGEVRDLGQLPPDFDTDSSDALAPDLASLAMSVRSGGPLAPLNGSGLTGRAMALHESPARRPAASPKPAPTAHLSPGGDARAMSRSGSRPPSARRRSSMFHLPFCMPDDDHLDSAYHFAEPFSTPVDPLPVANALLRLKTRALGARAFSFSGSVRAADGRRDSAECIDLTDGGSPRAARTVPRVHKLQALQRAAERFGSALQAKLRARPTAVGGGLFSADVPGVDGRPAPCGVKQVYYPAYDTAPAALREYLDEPDAAPSECEWRGYEEDDSAVAARSALAAAEAARAAAVHARKGTLHLQQQQQQGPVGTEQRPSLAEGALLDLLAEQRRASEASRASHAAEAAPEWSLSARAAATCGSKPSLPPVEATPPLAVLATSASRAATPAVDGAPVLSPDDASLPRPISTSGSLQQYLQRKPRRQVTHRSKTQPKNVLGQRVDVLRNLQASAVQQITAKKWKALRNYTC